MQCGNNDRSLGTAACRIFLPGTFGINASQAGFSRSLFPRQTLRVAYTPCRLLCAHCRSNGMLFCICTPHLQSLVCSEKRCVMSGLLVHTATNSHRMHKSNYGDFSPIPAMAVPVRCCVYAVSTICCVPSERIYSSRKFPLVP